MKRLEDSLTQMICNGVIERCSGSLAMGIQTNSLAIVQFDLSSLIVMAHVELQFSSYNKRELEFRSASLTPMASPPGRAAAGGVGLCGLVGGGGA